MKSKSICIAVIIGSMSSSGLVFADSHRHEGSNIAEERREEAVYQQRSKHIHESVSEDTDALEAQLGVGHDKAYYRNKLEEHGYAITNINANDDDYLEYEVVKDGLSYEVQVEFENGISDEIDVTTNFWQAEATERALADENYHYTYPAAVSEDWERASDRKAKHRWKADKDRIEEELGTGHDRAYYKQAMERMGYQITSINVDEADELEMEVVKGDQSYELEVAFDEETQKSTDVDMKSNFWETEATERAKGEE